MKRSKRLLPSDVMSHTSIPRVYQASVRTQHSVGLWQAFLLSLSPPPNPRKPAVQATDVVTKLMTSSLQTLPRLTNQQAWNKFHDLFHYVVFNNTANFALPIAPTTLAIFLLLACSIRTMRHPLLTLISLPLDTPTSCFFLDFLIFLDWPKVKKGVRLYFKLLHIKPRLHKTVPDLGLAGPFRPKTIFND